MTNRLAVCWLLVLWVYEGVMANPNQLLLEAPKSLDIQCAQILDAFDRAGTDPLLMSLLRLMNERMGKLESVSSFERAVPLPQTVQAIGLPTLKAEVLTLRLNFGDEKKQYLVRDSTGAFLRFRELLKAFGVKGTGKGSAGPHILHGLLACIAKAEREGKFSHEQLKHYVGSAFLKRKTLPSEQTLIRIPTDLDAELVPLLEKMGMKGRGAMNVYIPGAIHLMCDVFDVPQPEPIQKGIRRKPSRSKPPREGRTDDGEN